MLEARQLTKKYNDATALNAVSFTVNPGEIFCLLGANGAGKTTTINLFLNFIQPTSGEVLINGVSVPANPVETKKHLTYIPENLTLYPNLSGIENLDYFAGLSGKKYSKENLQIFLTEAGLQTEAQSKRVSTYSKGMRQKVGIALALAKDAKVLLLDEPTSGLDPKASNEFSELLTRLSKKGVATLMATHDLFRAKETGTHIGIMKQGVLVEQLTTDQINHTDLEKLYLKHMN
ncbi:MAG: ABC transporter ATP-binding protein [Cytophagales bacterium]|nr:ABC transporter ATP-binding protein [Cytophagales bacterium]